MAINQFLKFQYKDMGEKLRSVLGEPNDTDARGSQEVIKSDVHGNNNDDEQIHTDAGETMAEYVVKDNLI